VTQPAEHQELSEHVHRTADGTRLFVATIGDGQPLVLLHGGLGMDHTCFRPDFDALSDTRRVVYFDQRGNGRSAESAEPTTIESLAHDAAELIRSIGAPAAVIGHSFGGFVAQELALSHPDVVERLILVCTTPGQLGAADDPSADQGPPPPDEVVAIMSEMPSTDEEYAAAALRLAPYYVHGDSTPLVERFAHGIFRVRAMFEGFLSLATWSSVDRLHQLEMPVLVLAGDHDRFTSPQQSQRIARLIAHAELHTIRDAGHFPWVERGDDFFTGVRDFL